MLDEKALRRPGFVEGTRVTLGDGQQWTVPWGVLALDGTPGGVGLVLTDDEVDLLSGAAERQPLGFLGSVVPLAARLLRVNYDLAPADLALLLEYDDSPPSVEMWKSVVEAISGPGERSYARWLKVVLEANGVERRGLSLGNAYSIANGLVSRGLAPPASHWVDDAIAKRREVALESLF